MTEWMNKCEEGRIDEWMNGMNGMNGMNEWMKWTNGWMKWMNEWTNVRTNGWMKVCLNEWIDE